MGKRKKNVLNDLKRLNLGCGFDKKEGFINIDLNEKHYPDICADVTNLSFLKTAAYEEILAQDVLEHIERNKVKPTLKEWARLLKRGGVLTIRIPSLMQLLEMLADPRNRDVKKAEEVIHLIYGTQAYTGDYHLSGFTAELIYSYLKEAGLQITRAEIVHGWLFNISAKKTKSLKEPEDMVHNAYFKILGRPVDKEGLNHFVLEIKNNNYKYNDIVKQLKNSFERKFIKKYPKYLLGKVNLD